MEGTKLFRTYPLLQKLYEKIQEMKKMGIRRAVHWDSSSQIRRNTQKADNNQIWVRVRMQWLRES